MRILVINPNTTSSMTAKIATAARSVAGESSEIDVINPNIGPVSIEGYYDEAFALPGLLQCIVDGEQNGYDGFVIACFDDTGLDAARCVASGPVVGICEAAVHCASFIAHRFSVITTLQRSVGAIEGLIARYGAAHRCRVRACEVPVLSLEDPTSSASARIRNEVDNAIAQDGAEAILLGCAGMTDLAELLSEEVGLPVIDGVVCAVKLCESLVSLSLKTSKAGGYAYPRVKPYAGDLAQYAPLAQVKEK